MTISLKIVWLGRGGMFWVILGFALKGCEIVSETGESLVPDKKSTKSFRSHRAA